MSAHSTSERKIEDLRVGDVVLMESDDAEYSLLVTFVGPEYPDQVDPLDFIFMVLIQQPDGMVSEIRLSGMGNQRVEVLS